MTFPSFPFHFIWFPITIHLVFFSFIYKTLALRLTRFWWKCSVILYKMICTHTQIYITEKCIWNRGIVYASITCLVAIKYLYVCVYSLMCVYTVRNTRPWSLAVAFKADAWGGNKIEKCLLNLGEIKSKLPKRNKLVENALFGVGKQNTTTT